MQLPVFLRTLRVLRGWDNNNRNGSVQITVHGIERLHPAIEYPLAGKGAKPVNIPFNVKGQGESGR
jgi:hypothetical protein